MSQENLSLTILLIVLALFIVIRIYFSIVMRKQNYVRPTREDIIAREGKLNYRIRHFVLRPAMAIAVFLGYLYPSTLHLFFFPFPRLVMWFGALIGIGGDLFLLWVHVHLGKQWSVYLQLNEDHKLIQSGPYTSMRHPMYTALFTLTLSVSLICTNMIAFLIGCLTVVSVVVRVLKEEQMMIDKFGDEYRSYIHRTGRFFPRLGN